MLLAIDIGNTNISCALFKGARIIKSWDVPTKTASLKRNGLLKRGTLEAVVICSVVPKLTRKLCADLSAISGIKPYIIGKDINVPIKNLYTNRKQLGQDRLVNAYAAGKIYGYPVIAVSAGTAITLDVVSKDGAYLGGLIQPGLTLSISALAQNTAMIPQVKLKGPLGLIGRETRACILNGVILGTAGSIDSLVKEIKLKTGKNTPVIGTGGDIDLLKKFSKEIDRIDRDLTLKGIYLTYKQGTVLC